MSGFKSLKGLRIDMFPYRSHTLRPLRLARAERALYLFTNFGIYILFHASIMLRIAAHYRAQTQSRHEPKKTPGYF